MRDRLVNLVSSLIVGATVYGFETLFEAPQWARWSFALTVYFVVLNVNRPDK